MATSSAALPSSPTAGGQTPLTAPPNFYAQAASAQPATPASPANSEDTTKFRTAIEKLVTIFDKIEKLKPNGVDISKKVKAVAQSLKDLKTEVFEGEEGEGAGDTDLGDGRAAGSAAAGNAATGASPPPPPASTGGVAGTGA
jgi:soluble cytochrome b562